MLGPDAAGLVGLQMNNYVWFTLWLMDRANKDSPPLSDSDAIIILVMTLCTICIAAWLFSTRLGNRLLDICFSGLQRLCNLVGL